MGFKTAGTGGLRLRKDTCCFSGHRKLSAEALPALAQRLRQEILRLVTQGVRYFGCGGALGFDTLAAKTVLALRDEYPGIRLIMVLPCPDQAAFWSGHDQAVYRDILRRADKVVYTAQRYDPGCMARRNRALVADSAYCICFLDRPTGGTAYTVAYARRNGLTVINLADAPPAGGML